MANSGFISTPATVYDGQYVQLLILSGPTAASVQMTLTVRTSSTTWTVTTAGDVCAGSPAPGTICADGSKYAGNSVDGNVKMFTTPEDAGWFGFAWPEWVDHGYWDWVTGRANTEGMAQYPEYIAPSYCAGLVAHGRSDWYLPAPNEWTVLLANAAAVGGFETSPSATYWTSSESGSNTALYKRMDSFLGYTSKGIAKKVRCVRKD